MSSAERDIRRKLRVLKYFEQRGNIAKICRDPGNFCSILFRATGNEKSGSLLLN